MTMKFTSFCRRHIDTLTAALLALCAFTVYRLTMAPHLGTEDPGEIATALHGLGVLHPTGYPLYSLIGSLFARLPWGDSVIERLNLLSAVLTALATFLFHGTFRTLLTASTTPVFSPRAPAAGTPAVSPRRGAPQPPASRSPSSSASSSPVSTLHADTAARLGALVATLTFAFSAVYWFEAVWVEVYCLHLVFLALVVRLFVAALARPEDNRRWLMFAYVLGLSFAHHMMTVLLAPAFLLLFFQVHGLGRAAWIRIARAVPPFLLALTAYLYLPLRASVKPLMNWGDPSTPVALWDHIRGAQFRDQMFSSLEVAGRKLLQFGADLPGDFGYAPLVPALVGLWAVRRTPRLLTFTLLIFVTGVVYAINYAFDDANFYLNAHFAVALAGGMGAAWLWSCARGAGRTAVAAAVALVALCPLVFNLRDLDKSRDTVVVDYARNMLSSLDTNGVLFSNEYERFGSPAFYLQNVDGFRADATVFDVIMLGMPWYLDHLEQRDPTLMASVRPELTVFRTDLQRHLATRADSAAVSASLTALFHALVASSDAAGRPVYVTSGINPYLIERYRHAPTGMVFRLLAPDDTTRVPVREPRFAPLPESNRLTPVVRSDYALSYAYQGASLAQGGDTARALEFFRKSLALQPSSDVEAYRRALEGGSR